MVRIINYSPNLYMRSQPPSRASNTESDLNANFNQDLDNHTVHQNINFSNNLSYPVDDNILQQIEFRAPTPATIAAPHLASNTNPSPAPQTPALDQQLNPGTPYFPDPRDQGLEHLRRRLITYPESLDPDQIAHQQAEQARRRAQWSAQHGNIEVGENSYVDELLRVIDLQDEYIRRGQRNIEKKEEVLRELQNVYLPDFVHEDRIASDEDRPTQEVYDEASDRRPVRSRSASPRPANYQQPIRQRPPFYVETQLRWEDVDFGRVRDDNSPIELTERDTPVEDLTAGWPEEDEEVVEIVEAGSESMNQVTDGQLPPLYLQYLQHYKRTHPPPDPLNLLSPIQSPQRLPRTQALPLPQNPQPPSTVKRGRGGPRGNGRRVVTATRSRSPAETRPTIPRRSRASATPRAQPESKQQLRRSTRDRSQPDRLEAPSMAPPPRAPRPVAVRPDPRPSTSRQVTAPKKTIIRLLLPKPPSTTAELTTGQEPEQATAPTPDVQVTTTAALPVNIPAQPAARVRVKKEPASAPRQLRDRSVPPTQPTPAPASRPPSTFSEPYLFRGRVALPPNPTMAEIAVFRASWQPGQTLPDRIPGHVFLCYACGKRQSYKRDLTRHYKDVHAGEGLDVNAVFPHAVRTERNIHILVDANGADLPESQQHWPATGQGRANKVVGICQNSQ